MARIDPDDADLVRRRHPEWRAGHIFWRKLVDAYRGGETYRSAVYGSDVLNLPTGNLVRHPTEIPDLRRGEREHPDYAFRLQTPVPSFVAEAVEKPVAEIYAQEVTREPPRTAPWLEDWWKNVDGAQTSITEWMRQEVAALFLVCGFIDLACDRPKLPEGADGAVLGAYDRARLGLDRPIAAYYLPWNVVDWVADPITRYYRSVMILEAGSHDTPFDEDARYRIWTAERWRLLKGTGEIVEEDDNPYGVVPVRRVFDRIDPRRSHVGISRFESIAEEQREAWNAESEIRLSRSYGAHPRLQVPRSMIGEDGSVSMAPGHILVQEESTLAPGTYPEASYVAMPTTPGDAIRQDQQRIRDRVDRAAKLNKPAGLSIGNASTVVAQSGVSKAYDQIEGSRYHAELAGALQAVEWIICELALIVGGGRPPEQATLDALLIAYPRRFDLLSPAERIELATAFQDIAERAGDVPEVDGRILKEIIRELFVGLDEGEFEPLDEAIDEYVSRKAEQKEEARESGVAALAAAGNGSVAGDGRPVDDEEENANPFE